MANDLVCLMSRQKEYVYVNKEDISKSADATLLKNMHLCSQLDISWKEKQPGDFYIDEDTDTLKIWSLFLSLGIICFEISNECPKIVQKKALCFGARYHLFDFVKKLSHYGFNNPRMYPEYPWEDGNAVYEWVIWAPDSTAIHNGLIDPPDGWVPRGSFTLSPWIWCCRERP